MRLSTRCLRPTALTGALLGVVLAASASAQSAYVTQISEARSAPARSSEQMVTIRQRGDDNAATVSQVGAARAAIYQSGNGNAATLQQQGAADAAMLQAGNGNRLTAVQAATLGAQANQMLVAQSGDGNYADVTQSGGDRLNLVQTGSKTAMIEQGGNTNLNLAQIGRGVTSISLDLPAGTSMNVIQLPGR